MKSLLLAVVLFVPAVSMAAGMVFSPEQQVASQAVSDQRASAQSGQQHRPLIDVIILPAPGGAKQPTLDFGNGKAAISPGISSWRHSVYLGRPSQSQNVIICYGRACDETGAHR